MHTIGWLRGAVIGGLLGVLGVLLLVGVWQARGYASNFAYPDATPVSAHNRVRWVPLPTVRQDAAFRTTDPFPKVYNWYSTGFELGPESRAMSTCILLEETHRRMLLLEHMSVTLCDTPNDRMVFVERTLSLR